MVYILMLPTSKVHEEEPASKETEGPATLAV